MGMAPTTWLHEVSSNLAASRDACAIDSLFPSHLRKARERGGSRRTRAGDFVKHT